MSESSYRTILSASSIIGGAQVLNIVFGLIRMKAAAVLLGPAGVGLVGLYINLTQTAATVASLGVPTVGTRQIASANMEGGDLAVGRTRRALFWGTLVLALIGAVLFWLASDWVARVVLAAPDRAAEIKWLSLGVALIVATGYQSALLTGMRRVGDLARITIGAGLVGTVMGVLALWVWGPAGLLVMVLVAPAVTLILGHFFVARLGPAKGYAPRLPEMAREWSGLARLGFAFMLSGIVTLLGQLGARMLVQRELGPEALGQFQAAWTIGMTYLGFVLTAMGTDYFPRLSAVIKDPVQACRLVNEQTEVALLLCAPVLLLMLGGAPWVIRLLYSPEFGPAIDILRWQLLGDILKVISWPLGFVILARGAGKTFALTESLAMTTLLAGLWFGLTRIGLTASGIAFLAMYTVYLPLVWWLGGRTIDFGWSRAVKWQGGTLIAAAVTVNIVGRWSDLAGGALALILALAAGMWALRRLSEKGAVGGRAGLLAAALERRIFKYTPTRRN
ncbi:MAG: O-antigen translocase [Rhodobacteraceae bacterium]|nr:O-antigen translocase [Paracoccaceae bacterium]